ncbi:MAG: hypothetical protein EoVTN8_68 [Fluviibacter phosphoraccumulans EoVTN8]
MSDASNNPLNFLQGMWNQMGFQLPGMVTTTLDEGEPDKQIKDLKSVENWLRMNLSMLQMTIQNLEMQKSALVTFRSMSESFTKPEGAAAAAQQAESPFSAFFKMSQGAAKPETAPEPPPAPAPEAPAAPPANEADLTKAAMWPWEMMNELNAKMQAQLADAAQKQPARKKPAGSATAATRKAATAKKPAAKRSAKKPD